jgi:hypothetical protein
MPIPLSIKHPSVLRVKEYQWNTSITDLFEKYQSIHVLFGIEL